MSTLPTVEQLSTLTYREQADWLIRAPESWVSNWAGSIRAALEMTRFAEGMIYLDRRYAATIAVRSPDGNLPHTVMMSVFHAEGVMREAARRRDAVPRNDEIVSSRAGPTATPPEGACEGGGKSS